VGIPELEAGKELLGGPETGTTETSGVADPDSFTVGGTWVPSIQDCPSFNLQSYMALIV
jgi:hypothetical protein